MSTDRRSYLLIRREDAPPDRLELARQTIAIGRAEGNQLRLQENFVSKRHAEIRAENDGYVVVDLGSRNGLVVNGKLTTRHELRSGDRIELGFSSPVTIEFHDERPQPGADPLPESTMRAETIGYREYHQGQMARLAKFFEFGRKLGGGFALDEVLQDVVDLAIDVTGAERGMIVFRRDDGEFDMQSARRRDGTSVPAESLFVSRTLLNRAFESSGADVIEDVRQEDDLSMADSIVSLDLRSAVTLPLRRFVAETRLQTAVSVVFGILYLDSSRRRGGFDKFDMSLLQRLAQDASSVIENVRLLEEEKGKKRIEQELEMAREVQATLMPDRFVATEQFDIAGTCVPSYQLGGDYVDQFTLPDGRMLLVVADVCGKGIAASLLAATLQGTIAATIQQPTSLEHMVGLANRVHHGLAPIGKFITMTAVMLSPDGGVELVNAGHCPTLHVRADGVRVIDPVDMALGLDGDATFTRQSLQLAPGESIVLVTDGVAECENANRELFGDQQLEQLVARLHGNSPHAMLDRITREVERHRAGAAVSDDLTALIIQRRRRHDAP